MVMSGAAHPPRAAVSSKSSSSGDGERGGCSDSIANRPPRFARTLAAVMRSSRPADRRNGPAVRSLASGVRMRMAASRVQYRARCRRARIRRTVKRDRTVGGDDPRISPSPHRRHYNIIVRRKYYYCLSVSRSRSLSISLPPPALPHTLPSGRTYAHARTHCTACTYSPRHVPCKCVQPPLAIAATAYLYIRAGVRFIYNGNNNCEG